MSDGIGTFVDFAAGVTKRFTGLAEEMIESSRANRELMIKLVGGEVEKVANQLGLARHDEIDDLRRELADVRIALAHQTARIDELRAARRTPAKKSPAKKSPATKASTTKTAAAKTAATKTTAAKKTSAAKTSAAKKTPASRPRAGA